MPIGQMGYVVKDVGSTLKWDPAKSSRLFKSLREDRPLAAYKPKNKALLVPVAPQQIRVQVENGTAAGGLGKRVDAALAATGFRTTGFPVDSADRTLKRTVVAYDPRWDRSARSLAAALPGSELRAVKGQGAVLKVIAGADFERVRKVRAEDELQGSSGWSRGTRWGACRRTAVRELSHGGGLSPRSPPPPASPAAP